MNAFNDFAAVAALVRDDRAVVRARDEREEREERDERDERS